MLLVLNVMSIINFRANECPGTGMGHFSAAIVSYLAANGEPVPRHCSDSVIGEAVERCKQIYWALG